MRKAWVLLWTIGILYAAWHFRDVWGGEALHARRWAKLWGGGEPPQSANPIPDAVKYQVLRGELQRWRDELHRRHGAAGTDAARDAVVRDAGVLLAAALPELMACWLGTPWDFHGTAALPGAQPIACGYFVSTVLRDAGFEVDRYRLAQQPSSHILTSMIPKAACRLMVDQPYERFSGEVEKMGVGVYLVGLDTHVAFLVVTEEEGFHFIHSSGAAPWCVVCEGEEHAQVLKKSRWRMLANLTADRGLLQKWMAREVIAVREP